MAVVLKKRNNLLRQEILQVILLIIIFFVMLLYFFIFKCENIITKLFPFILLYFFYINIIKYKKLKSGIKGEKLTLEILKKLNNNYIILSDLKIHYKNKKAQIDNLVIGKNGIFIIETKNVYGIVTGSGNNTYVNVLNNKKEPYFKMYNPCKQVLTHKTKLNELLKLHNLNSTIEPIVFFSNYNTKVNIKNKNVHIFTEDNHCELIKHIRNFSPKHTLKKSEIDSIVNLLKDYL